MIQRIFAVVGLVLVLVVPAFGDNVNIADISVASGKPYEDGGMIAVGSDVFFDKEVTILGVPDEIKGAQFIKGWNEDAKWHWNNPLDPLDKILDQHKSFMTITVDSAVKLWILFESDNDENAIKGQADLGGGDGFWLWNDFEETDIVVPAKGSKMEFIVFKAKKIYPKGKIVLGSLSAQGQTMYIPLVADATAAQQPVQPEDKLAAVWGGLKATR